MPFPTVRSDPWKKRRRARRRLWLESCWRRLTAQARQDWIVLHVGGPGVISPNCLELIAEFNRWTDQKETDRVRT